MSVDPRLQPALDAIRQANGVIESIQRNEFILTGDQIAASLSSVRIELSCAAATLAAIIDGPATLRPLGKTSVKVSMATFQKGGRS